MIQTKEEIIKNMLGIKAEENAGIDLKAYASGLEDMYKVLNIPKISIPFEELRNNFFNEHVTTSDKIPKICTRPLKLFEWLKNELKEYGC